MTTTIAQFPFISISGTAHERGVQYGQQAADRIRGSIALYGQTLARLGHGAQAQARLIDFFARQIGDYAPHYIDEMRGIAKGANVDFADIVMINARTEVLAKARAAVTQEPVDGCTGALILPERSASGNLLHGQNWDWRAECTDTAIVLRVRNDHGPDFLSFVEAGGLARSGFNSAGVSITANYLESSRDFTQLGVPLSLIRRKVLEQEVFSLAMKVVATTPKSCSNNIMLGMAEGFGIDFECTTNEFFPLYPGADALIVHANHWVSPVALGKLVDIGIANSPDSHYRDWRVRKLLNAAGPKLSRQHLKDAFFDDFGQPWSVCRPPRPGSHDNLSATVATVIMEPAMREMDITPLPALNKVFTRYSLDRAPELLMAA
ncbi:C45 family autoproteolytic acyltransferase/hydolase [Verminephrobacter eiseniae]|uniref:Peptidase C45, acyl-coenzyme A n=1 Tax=Verminephrobacter eiseniae (strain EF01-2) TaxID=391735 RepID=A1WS15_VEREI|nr:C45 family peptidase [Verminephrobacter eiseniae]ABM60422.1 peptidase C45, acyl-coenzyme A [Verminephrobacter eiseniae EF01-2]MCW5285897.1 acyl-CoA--6-aminopenicillanic acid acyltransferase [Verminephrobacter eiseniae]MCW5304195.1 acyl-CoA--6-aminopenicillanic acid acyltransferase [Verminephrobacter eiseniae]MCW8179415.1 acyl-CoA--6-aminopenicillanic acid acyltransferase [Verminephrobacter eiseniae]MCW8191311.1 acyl-CoA--6-aminopenicillanic acid acyltransferase [Verminephrobacter eiseniae]